MVTYAKLLVLVLDTSTFVDDVNVVGEECISRVLRNDTQRNNNGKPPSVAFGLEKVQITGASLGVTICLDGLLDLAILELHGWVVHVAAAVVPRQNIQGFFRFVLVDEKTR